MASTNKTTHYELSQFLGTDKPAWLGDYNSDMQKIDTGINGAQTTATGADGKADANTSAIGTLTSLTTDVKTDLVSAINEVDGHADTAQGTASSAQTTANNASTAVTNLSNYFKMTQFTTPTATMTGGSITNNEVSCAGNSNGSLGKIYGRVNFDANVNGTATISFATPLRPTSAITITGGGLAFWAYSGSDAWSPIMLSYSLATDGTCTISLNVNSGNKYRVMMINSLIFATDFGDIPLPE